MLSRIVALTFKKRLKLWRGKRLHKEAAADLGVALSTYRKWEYGKRTPNAVSMAEIERRLEATSESIMREHFRIKNQSQGLKL